MPSARAGRRGAACQLLGLDPDRAAGWRGRAARRIGWPTCPCGGGAVHGLLEAERAAIVELFDALGRDRPLAIASWPPAAPGWSWCTSRRPRCGGCWPRKALCCKDRRAREPAIRAPWPDWIEWKPERRLVLRLHPLHPGPAGRRRRDGRGLAALAVHPGLGRGDLHPDRGRVPRRPRRASSSPSGSTRRLLARAARRRTRPRPSWTAPKPTACRC